MKTTLKLTAIAAMSAFILTGCACLLYTSLEMAPQAKVIALDVEAHRLKRVEENLARLNQQATVVCGDATEPEKDVYKRQV